MFHLTISTSPGILSGNGQMENKDDDDVDDILKILNIINIICGENYESSCVQVSW